MKPIVRIRFFAPEVAALVGLAIVAVTGAGVGATYLIVLALLAILIGIEFGPERVRLSREKRAAAAHRSTR